MDRGFLSAVLCAVVLGLASTAVPSRADAKSKLLIKARKAYEDLDYGKAQALLQKALKANASFADQIEIYMLLATVHAVYGRDDQARAAFLEVIKRDPDRELPPETSPKIRAAFADAKEVWKGDGSPRVTAQAPGGAGEGTDSDEEPKAAPATTGNTTQVVQAAPVGVVEPANPLMTGVTSYERQEPFYETWWFWTVVGVVVIGGGSTAIWYLTKPSLPEHDFGPIRLP